MAFDKKSREGSESSPTVGSSESNRIENDLSPDDVAWIDSCIVNDLEDSDGNWNSPRHALLEIVNNQPESLVSSSIGTNFSAEVCGMNIVLSHDKAETKGFVKSLDDDFIVPTHEEAETMNNSSVTEEDADILSLLAFEDDPSKNSLQDAGLPNREMINETHDSLPYSNVSAEAERMEDGSVVNHEAGILPSKLSEENLRGTSLRDNIMQSERDSLQNSSFPEGEIELSSRDIFKVWDLEVPSDEEEEDEFEKQLKKALDETSRQTVLPSSADSLALGDLWIDDLIAGISDLSLDQSLT